LFLAEKGRDDDLSVVADQGGVLVGEADREVPPGERRRGLVIVMLAVQ